MHKQLRAYRRARGIRQAELAHELGFANASGIWRRERPPWHPEHVPMSRLDFAEAIAAIERIVERRQREMSVAEVLAP